MKQFFSAYLFLFLLVLFGYNSGKSQTAESVTDQTVQSSQKLAKSLLWEVSGNGLEKSSYVFGTIHIIGSEDYFFPEIAEETFSEANQIAFEIDMDDMNDMSSMFSIMQSAFMSNGQTLQDLLSVEDYGIVKNHFEEMGLPLMFLERIKPMFLSVMTSGDMNMMDLQGGNMVSYEMELYEKAQQSSKNVEGLETMEFQMGLFDSIPYEVQAQMLVQGISSSKEGDDQFEDMIEMYKDQNIDAMHNMIQDDEEGLADFENLLVRKRNENWIPKMKQMMSVGPTFFAVGAGHLGGPHGVIRLLKKAGYKVTPLMDEPIRKI